jgi:hypothetical protein
MVDCYLSLSPPPSGLWDVKFCGFFTSQLKLYAFRMQSCVPYLLLCYQMHATIDYPTLKFHPIDLKLIAYQVCSFKLFLSSVCVRNDDDKIAIICHTMEQD